MLGVQRATKQKENENLTLLKCKNPGYVVMYSHPMISTVLQWSIKKITSAK